MPYIFVISGPSGVGKTTICNLIKQKFINLELLITTTTRQPREKEVDGIDYNFISKEIFNEMIVQNKFVEHTTIYNNHYGIQFESINQIINKNYHPVLNINYQGLLKLKNNNLFKNIVSIFISPPSIESLKQRMSNRNEHYDLSLRISEAELEIKNSNYYDYYIINHDLNKAVSEVNNIISKYLSV